MEDQKKFNVSGMEFKEAIQTETGSTNDRSIKDDGAGSRCSAQVRGVPVQLLVALCLLLLALRGLKERQILAVSFLLQLFHWNKA